MTCSGPRDDESDELDDRELPDESDMDREDEPELMPCPHCGKAIHENADWCHLCGQYLSNEEAPSRLQTWMIVTIGLLLAGFVLMILSGVF